MYEDLMIIIGNDKIGGHIVGSKRGQVQILRNLLTKLPRNMYLGKQKSSVTRKLKEEAVVRSI